jgi:hypothetical protein
MGRVSTEMKAVGNNQTYNERNVMKMPERREKEK